MAAEIWFYHLEQASPDAVLPDLLEKTRARGWKALVVSPDEDRLKLLDMALWTERAESFLPHGLAREAHAERQPILLSSEQDPVNGAECLFLLDGELPTDPDAFTRTLLLFDGHDEQAIQAARGLWKTSAAAGHTISYWKQSETGRWEKKA